jgi:penicillin-binding protein 2
METEADRNRTFSRRALLLAGAQAGVGALILGRLTYLSVFEGSHYALLAEENRVSLRLIAPPRGMIVDRFGIPLAVNRPDYRLAIIPEQVDDLDATLAQINALFPLSLEEIARIEKTFARVPKFIPVEVARDIDWEAFARVNVRLPELSGLQPVQGFTRHYPDGPAVGHLLGYVGSPSEAIVEEDKDPLLALPGFKVGKDGVERALEPRLRGRAGANRVEVNAHGRVIRELSSVPARPGDTSVLTIDRELQLFTAQRLQAEAASAIVMGVDTGEILALASVPSFDPNVFSRGIRTTEWAELTSNERTPLLNKPVQGQFPPGSTFKMCVALAALEAGVVVPEDSVVCTGRYRLGGHFFHCWRRRGHGRVNLMSGVYESCDTYFYHIGRLLGPERIAEMARRFGLGETYDLPILNQKEGLVPDPEWKLRRRKKAWLPGETLNISIGQGAMLATPLQMAVMTARLASGRAVVPKLLRTEREPEPAPLMAVNQDHLALIRQAMADVVNARGGTARGARLNVAGFTMAGKTGTAQVRRITMAERRSGVRSNEQLPWRLRDHALFVGFAPVEQPRYAVAVVVEHGGSGSKAAAPVARDLLELALRRDPLARRSLLAGAAPPATGGA